MVIRVLIVLALVVSVTSVRAENVHGMLPQPGEPVREGFAIGVALGATGLVAGGGTDLSGIGGGPSLRFGTSAGDNLLWLVQLDASGYLFEIAGEKLGLNQMAVLSLAGQYFVKPALWTKLGFGIATVRQEVREMVALDPIETFRGPSVLAAAGVELVQRGSLALGVEAQITVTKIEPTAIAQGTLAVAVHYY